jgi:hypothetical protein
MRRYRATLFAAWLGAVASSAVCASTWIAQDDALVRVANREPVQLGVRALSPTNAGGAWVTADGELWALSADGEVRAHVDLAGRGFGNALTASADAYDGSVWVATDTSLLLHFARNASLEHGTTLSTPAAALATDLDASAWLVAQGELLHFARDGAWLGTRALSLGDDETVTALASDALRDQNWIATSHGVYRAGRSAGSGMASVPSLRGAATALALDPRSGAMIAIVDGLLVGFDIDTEHRREIPSPLVEGERPLGLLYDANDAAFIIETTRGLVRVESDGTVLERLPALLSSVLAAAPFRVEPTLALVRPPNGGATTDPRAEIVLSIGASCNGNACELQSYLRNLRVDAALDNVTLGEPLIDTATGRATFPRRPSLAAGHNELSARVVDAFGHQAILERVRWTLLAPATDAMEVASEPANEGRAPVVKAANKTPTVLLTSPANGDVFSAGGTILLGATAADIDGSITKVEFYRGGTTLIGTTTVAPYRYGWVSPSAGSYSLTAKAYDDRRASATSQPVTIVVANNQPPAVSMTSPDADSFIAAESDVTVGAIATDPDGTIASLEFFDGTTSIGTTTVEPYRVTWHAASAGLHSLSARATDTKGGTGQSSPITVTVGGPPVVVVTGPTACSFIDGPINVALTADALSTGGRVVTVEFFDEGSSVGIAFASPWRSTLVNASIGSHSITAKATDDHGLAATARASTFTIRGANQPPSVILTSPSEGARFAFGSTVGLAATAADTDGTIVAVEFRNGSAGGSLLGRTTTPPYAASWANMPVGSYAIVAVAYDDRGAATTSAPVHVTINANALPTVALSAPAANARFTAPASIAVAASASDSDGTIAKVEFFAGATPIGTSNAAPYTATWSNVGVGSYSVTAKATDNAGGVVVSTAVPITVVNNTLPTVTLTAPGSGGQYFAPATISLTATAADGDGTVAKVEFYANGSLIGTSSTAPYGIVWDGVAAGSYLLNAKAVDDQGGISTSAEVNIIVNAGVTINAAPGLDGSVVDDDSLLVTGTINAPANSGVLINGVIAQVDLTGHFYANNVPLVPGDNILTLVVLSQDGQSATQTVALSSSGAAPFAVSVSPADGFAPLPVLFEVINRANRTFQRIEFDLNGDGSSDYSADASQFVDGVLKVAATYPAGTFTSTIKVYDTSNVIIYTAVRVITARTIQQHDDLLRGVYTGMLNLLKTGRIPDALNAVTGDMQERYGAVFTAIGSALPAAVDSLGSLQPNWFGPDHAEYVVIRDTPDGPQGFLIDFLRGADGVWRIDGM